MKDSDGSRTPTDASPDGAYLRPWRDDDINDLLVAFSGSGMRSQGADNVRDESEAQSPWCPETGVASLAGDVGGRAVGNVSLTSISRRHNSAWVSYWIAEASRGHGFASRATATLAAWALREGDLYRLELGHRLNNPESGRVAVAAGFQREGTQRKKLRYGDERFDVGIYARLATDPAPPIAPLSFRIADPHMPRNGNG